MRTGEGKTLVATLPLYLNALTRRGVHLVTVNDYLARRDAALDGPDLSFARSVGRHPADGRGHRERQESLPLRPAARASTAKTSTRCAWWTASKPTRADITYGTNSEFGFDYLRDNMTMRLEDRVQRGHYYSIVDEVDNVLIDEARTPLIISGPASGDVEWYGKMAVLVRQLRDGGL